ncbi:MAG: carboxypeptidase-like regulatory domain-containing protein, partial [Acidobacteriota bacterium]
IENQASVAKITGTAVNFTADPINTAANTFTIQNETDFASYSIGIDPSPCPSGQRLWDGGGTTNNWSDAANWACDLIPQNGNNIVFDTTSTKDTVIDIPISVNSFRINAGFTGSLTLASNTFSSADFTQSDGTFNGGTSSISVTGAFVQSAGNFNGGNGPMSVGGGFSITGGAFVASNNSTSFASNFKHNGGTFDPNSGTVIFTGNAASGINQGLPVTTIETFNNLAFQRTGIVILKVNGILNVLGDLNLNTGQIQQDVFGSVFDANGDVVVGSDFNGLIPLNHIGSRDQKITVTGSPLTPWGNWTIDKPAGTVTLASNLKFNGSNGVIFRNGIVKTDQFVLDLGGSGGFAENGYVVGNLRKALFGTGTFEVGTESGYSPVTLNSFGVFTVRANEGPLAGADPARSIKRNWTITSSGSQGDLTLQYADADVPAGAAEEGFKFIRQNGTLNEVLEPTTIDTASNTFVLNNVTEFSTWTLGQLVPTAAAVEIRGRVSTRVGSGISRARITITDQNGDARTAVTNPFGYYIISGVEAGRSYVLSVKAKGYSFASSVRVITVDDYISGLDFIADN